MEKKRPTIAYFVALGVFIVLLVVLGISYKDAPILIEDATTPFAGTFWSLLPPIVAIGFATGTSWGTIGIMAPIVVQVFNYDAQPILCTIGLAAACAGGVMGDHCSPISDTTIMASAGAHCYHLNHVFTQIPYALTVAGVSFVSFILAGLLQNVVICLVIACVLMVATLLVIRAIMAKKHQGIFQEMAEADKALAK